MEDGAHGFVADEDIGGLKVAFFASPIARSEQVEGPTARVRAELSRLAGELWAERPVAASIPVAVVLTGGTEDLVLAWLDRPEMSHGPSVLLLALPYANSLPASLEILARLRQDGRGGRVLVLERPGWREALALRLQAVETATFLRTARLGLVGGASSWLAASSPSPGLVRERWGPEVVTIPLDELLDAYHDAVHGRGDHAERDRAELEAEVTRLRAKAAGVVEPDDKTLLGAVAFHRALRELVDRYRLQAVTVRCFDLLGPTGNTGCVAMARLNDEGVTAACEGDLPAALTMMVLQRLTGRPAFMANPSDVDLTAGTVTFAHCTVPTTIVSSFRLRSHFETGLGVALEGRFAVGPVTVARIGGRGLDAVRVFQGTVRPGANEPREDLCRTQVTLEVDRWDLGTLLECPLGNHHIIVPGGQVAAFQAVADEVAGAAARLKG